MLSELKKLKFHALEEKVHLAYVINVCLLGALWSSLCLSSLCVTSLYKFLLCLLG